MPCHTTPLVLAARSVVNLVDREGESNSVVILPYSRFIKITVSFTGRRQRYGEQRAECRVQSAERRGGRGELPQPAVGRTSQEH